MKLKNINLELHFSILEESTDLNKFDCGEEELNLFLKELAFLFQNRHFGVTMTCTNKTDRGLIGYYTVCPASIQRETFPEKFMTGPRPNPIPAFRLCRLAVDKKYQNQGYGKILLVHALKKCLEQSKQIGGSVIVIDAKHARAKHFYEHYGFIPLPENPFVLIQTIKYVERHFS